MAVLRAAVRRRAWLTSFLSRLVMPSTATATLSLQYTPPSAAANSGGAVFPVSVNHNAQNVGQIDVNPADTPPTSFPIPFGSVAKAKLLVIKNLMTSEIGVRLNGVNADQFAIAAGGVLCYAAPAAPAATPITACIVLTTAAPASVESIQYFVFGD